MAVAPTTSDSSWRCTPRWRLLDRLLLERKRRPDAIVADTYLAWGVAVGARRGIPVCSLWTMAATFCWALYHVNLWPSVKANKAYGRP
uniref:Uncharacterized protein n=1 Tax=Oryza punctata TaxID=4537 RepID=A0A0E0M681_ORYPU